jgi:general secretion pathway protein G
VMSIKTWRQKNTGGFSLTELLVSVAIMGVLASVAMPLAETGMRRQKEIQLRSALKEIRNGIDAYRLASANGRIAVQTGQSGYPPSLGELAGGVVDAANPNGPHLYFLRRIPRDPFHSDKVISAADTWGKRSFSSPPDEPHEGDDVFDVYSLSSSTGVNGVPYAEW